ncbi:UDP-glucose:glycoprotein glucosyltransferase 1-like [Watersipora subatra]|uniref:UDP-glucose:glycoprotein glucosyltransferase 1-like n=1 Tax=Watersipora subatra TaxID=2589382 RepID=UPI00355C2C54
MYWLTFVVLLSVTQCYGKMKPVRISLDAKWNSSPLLLEASEFMADEGLFMEFVDLFKDHSLTKDLDNDESWHYHTLKMARRLLSPSRIKLLEFALSMRLYSPRVQLHQQTALEEGQACSAFAVVGDKTVCSSSALKDVSFHGEVNGPLHSGDEKRCVQHCGANKDQPVILYGELGSPELTSFLNIDTGSYTVLRHYVKVKKQKKVRLSGYGVELAIKSTEYKAQDDSKQDDSLLEPLEGAVSGFNFSRLGVRYPELRKELQAYKSALSESSNELKPLKAWQIQDLSFQAAQKAVDSSDASLAQLEVLKDISQNFPSLTSSLAKVQIRDSFRKSVQNTQKKLEQYAIGSGDSALLINGITMDIDTVDMFSLYDIIREDLSIMDELSMHGLANEDAGSLLKQLSSNSEQQFALDIRDSAIVYINDLENDNMYSHWPRALNSLLQPTFPGMMRHLSRNLFNLVLIFDVMEPTVGASLELYASLYSHQAPIRIGFVPVALNNDPVGELLVQVFYKLVDDKDGVEAILSFAEFYQNLSPGKVITQSMITQEFKKLGSIEEIIEDEEYINSREKAHHFYKKSGLGELPIHLLNGIPLEGMATEAMDEVIVTQVLKITPTFQRAVYHGKLTDDMDPLEWLMMQDHVMPRLNSRILDNKNKCVSLTAKSGMSLDTLKYLYKGASDSIRDTTMLVIADLDTPSGRQLLLDSITHMKTTKKVRVGVIYNHDTGKEGLYTKAVKLAMDTLADDEARSFVTKILQHGKDVLDISDLEHLAVSGMDTNSFINKLNSFDSKHFADYTGFVRSKLMLTSGQRAVISNGRLVGPLAEDEEFTADDFALLERFGASGDLTIKVSKIVKKMKLDSAKASNLMSQVLGTLSCTSSDRSRKDMNMEDGGESMISLAADTSEPAFEVIAVIEPLSRGAQKLLPILLTLQKVVNSQMMIYLNCREKLSELPLKSYYRYVLDSEIKFNVVGGLASGPEATFDSLPHKSILTLNVLPPEGWLVESVAAAYDLDNIKLEQVSAGVDAVYELEYLLLEGHCYDSENGQPPRGLQLLLGRGTSPELATADTLVMANLGYFQLKANPGTWNVMIRPGRSADIYSVTSHEHTDSPSASKDVVVVMDSFKSRIINMRVGKREGMESEDLLSDSEDEGEESGGLWNSISSTLGGGTVVDEEKDEHLNIFSLASGHLYERLMRIMILSIVKQTKSPVKFWLLKNYLSPEFKDFIPVMAKEYGFKYELVQYKWPRWLNQQTEKQRVMWGYKILFLDVLFPLGVKKIAFIDADQIVRTDIQELFDLDLGNAAYGYTPFCDSRKEMDGFRFWKSGYWASHLGRRPYHISALYVIDLKKFRKIAAGDRLRGQYQALSQDPNSLSNLDQDLPNNMIHQVKIKSLPQDWLWCETWCSDESKVTAKTIDLCNNPKTKENKLDAARRIVPEWTGYDTEVKQLWDKWLNDSSEELEADESVPSEHSHIEL